MKQITDKEFEKIEFKRRKGISNDLIDALKTLEVGGHLFLSRKEWSLLSEPGNLIKNSTYRITSELVKTKYSVKQLARSGVVCHDGYLADQKSGFFRDHPGSGGRCGG